MKEDLKELRGRTEEEGSGEGWTEREADTAGGEKDSSSVVEKRINS